jgi:hypothetical protein
MRRAIVTLDTGTGQKCAEFASATEAMRYAHYLRKQTSCTYVAVDVEDHGRIFEWRAAPATT